MEKEKRYLFQFEEHNYGCIEVYAENEEEALDLAYSGDGTIHIHKGDAIVGELIEVTD
jgi:hypothetical protein